MEHEPLPRIWTTPNGVTVTRDHDDPNLFRLDVRVCTRDNHGRDSRALSPAAINVRGEDEAIKRARKLDKAVVKFTKAAKRLGLGPLR